MRSNENQLDGEQGWEGISRIEDADAREQDQRPFEFILDPKINPELVGMVGEYQEKVLSGPLFARVRAFGDFLYDYSHRKDDNHSPDQRGYAAESAKSLTTKQRELAYTHSAQVIYPIVLGSLRSPRGDFESWFTEDQDVIEMLSEIYDAAPQGEDLVGETDKNFITETTVVGQRVRLVEFYSKAKRYFFSDMLAGKQRRSEDWYLPTEAVNAAFVLDRELLDKVKAESGSMTEFGYMNMYAKRLDAKLQQIESSKARYGGINDGNNIINGAIMYASLEDDPRSWVSDGGDLQIVVGLLNDRKKGKYGNQSACNLWAGLYLDLREELFGEDKNEANIKTISELRKEISS